MAKLLKAILQVSGRNWMPTQICLIQRQCSSPSSQVSIVHRILEHSSIHSFTHLESTCPSEESNIEKTGDLELRSLRPHLELSCFLEF